MRQAIWALGLLWACGSEADGDKTTESAEPGGTVADLDGDGVLNDEDCAPADGSVYPGAEETCDGVDQDCNGAVDDGARDAVKYYPDTDQDGWGDEAVAATERCEAPDGYTPSS